ncbi:MAG TPA: sulfotransferase [Solirubrobacterales bacterium]|nr:sulfotransferase [Solirubrobacterales bacterium]
MSSASPQTEARAEPVPPAAAGGGLPDVVVIGAQKCGTSALHSYLAKHPETSMSQPKELDFFIASKNWGKGVDWYRGHFDPAAKLRGESSPNYTADPVLPGVPERMAELIPDAKLIFIVRDPIDRARAQWIHNYSNRVQDKPLRRAVLEDAEYVIRSRYHHQLSRFLEHYPLERILVLEQDELLSERAETLRRVFAFLGLREDFWHPSYDRKRHETQKRRRKTAIGLFAERRLPKRWWRRVRFSRPFSIPFEHTELDDATRDELAERLRDDVTRLRELTGKPFGNWSL